MWLQDDNQHSFPIKAPEDNFLQGAKARLEKDFEFEEINKKNKDWKEHEIFSSPNCKINDILTSPEQKSVVTSLTKQERVLIFDDLSKALIQSFWQVREIRDINVQSNNGTQDARTRDF